MNSHKSLKVITVIIGLLVSILLTQIGAAAVTKTTPHKVARKTISQKTITNPNKFVIPTNDLGLQSGASLTNANHSLGGGHFNGKDMFNGKYNGKPVIVSAAFGHKGRLGAYSVKTIIGPNKILTTKYSLIKVGNTYKEVITKTISTNKATAARLSTASTPTTSSQ